jgi:phosphate transport system permease protein
MEKVIDLSPVARPSSSEPWKSASKKGLLQVAAVSILPLLLSYLIGSSFQLEAAVTAIVVFLPLQIAFVGFLGWKEFGKRGIADGALVVALIFFATLVLVLLISVLWSVIIFGSKALSLSFVSQNNVYISATTSMEYGGIGHALVGTLLIVSLTTVATIPLGLGVAVFLTETRSKARGSIRVLIQAMSGLPSVVAGLFVYSALIVSGISSYSGFAGSLALLPLMLPTVARIAEEALRLVPSELRNGALALGAPAYRAFFQVTLPAAKSGIITALILGVARIIGETAPLILTASTTNGTTLNMFGAMPSLPYYIYEFLGNGFDTSTQRAWGAALVILILVGILFTIARVLTRKKNLTAKKRKK